MASCTVQVLVNPRSAATAAISLGAVDCHVCGLPLLQHQISKRRNMPIGWAFALDPANLQAQKLR